MLLNICRPLAEVGASDVHDKLSCMDRGDWNLGFDSSLLDRLCLLSLQNPDRALIQGNVEEAAVKA